ncbi:MAG: GTP-binding protein [Pirellulales bacterium]|nr:GTP-binding protein [Pirellulales bacterium]
MTKPRTHETTPSTALDADYEAAMRSVRASIEQFRSCGTEEREALRHELDQLHAMSEKLAAGRVEIVVFGEISTGKSALINALVGQSVAEVNVRGGWTRDVWDVNWQGAGYCVPGLAKSQVVLIDTPGLNEVDGAQRTAIAHEAASRADLVLFVVDSDLNEVEYSALVELSSTHKPILLILNKADLYPPQELEELLSVFRGSRLAGVVEPANVITAKADPRQVEYFIESADGATRQEWRKPQPDVAALRERILEVLTAEGKALLALNAAMYAADKSDRMAALRVQMRNEKATATIWSFAVLKALGVASNPLAVADVLGGTAVDAVMVVTLGQVYGIEITTANARSLITSILKAAGWVMLSEVAVSYTSSFFKAVTGGWGTVLTALPQGAAAGYGSYIVGQAARYYFEHGASWGQQGPKRVVAQILENTDKQSVLDRIKAEIKKRLAANKYAGK